MLLWDGACQVHEKFSATKIQQLKNEHPAAKVLVHPECPPAVISLADKVGSTAALLKYSVTDEAQEFIVVTESGILVEMQRLAPHKTFIPAPAEDSDNTCNECEYMKLVTLNKLYNCLKYEWPAIEVEPEMGKKAVKSIHKMLEISKSLGL